MIPAIYNHIERAYKTPYKFIYILNTNYKSI